MGWSAGKKTTTIGYLSEPTGFNFSSFISGAGWLLRQGASYVNKSREYSPTDGFYTEKAPRTGVGLSKAGAVMLLVVDGIETENEGVDLFEFAEIFASKGAWNAINLDGGGSSDMVSGCC
jgi:exopolysaccharide biosynthesis protein